MIDYIKKYKEIIIISIIVIFISIIVGIYYFNKNNKKYDEISMNDSLIKKETNKEEKVDSNKIKEFFVEIKGEVNKPGVYKVNENNIIDDLIKLAGNLTKNAYVDNINLSKKLSPEMVIVIYNKNNYKKKPQVIIKECVCDNHKIDECIKKEESVIVPNNNHVNNENNEENKGINTTENNKTNNDNKIPINKKININTAPLNELMTLSGIGESKANKIIEYRNKTPFKSIQEIKNVSGIGDATFENIKGNITI